MLCNLQVTHDTIPKLALSPKPHAEMAKKSEEEDEEEGKEQSFVDLDSQINRIVTRSQAKGVTKNRAAV
jgi:hypothetical protein